jgi:hypothetical protein
MKKHPITWFYILAFGISWLGMVSAALGELIYKLKIKQPIV